jgi:hypothetical protein
MAEDGENIDNEKQERRNRLLQERIELLKESIALHEEENKHLIGQTVHVDKLNEKNQAEIELARQQIAQLKLIIKLEGDLDGEHQKKIKILADLIKTRQENNEALAEEKRLSEGLTDAITGLFGMNNKFKNSLLGSIDALTKSENAQKMLGARLKETITVQNVAYSLVKKFTQATMKLAYEQDAALASFNKQTGAARLYGDEISALEEEMYRHGVTMDDAANSYGALATTVFGLKNMSASTRQELSTTTALLGELGVEAESTAANVQFMTASLGMSVTSAVTYQRELFSLAQQIGMPPEQMAAGFKAAAPKLAAFGKQAGKVFKDLAVNARAAGMEVDQMLNIVEKFDTFEGAADSVGKLNALLGGPFLNSLEMVTTTDPTERMRMLSAALNDAGKSFDQMSYYERKSIAAAAGLSDVNELALVMAGSFDKSAGSAGKSQAEIQKLAEQTKEFQTIQEELMQTMRMFAVQMRPVITFVKDLLQGIQDLNKSMGFDSYGGLIGILLGVIASVMILKRVFGLFGVAMKVFNATATVTNSVLSEQTDAVDETGEVAKRSAPQLLALGAAALMMGAGVAIAAYGLSKFVSSFAPFDAGEILAVSVAIGVFGGVMYALIGALMALTTGPQAAFFALAVAGFLAISVGVALAATAMGYFVSSMGELFKVASVDKLFAFASAMAIFLGALMLVASASAGVAVASIAIAGLAASFSLLETKKVESLTEMFRVLAQVTAESADNIMNMGVGLGLTSAALAAMAINPLAYAVVPALLAGTAAGAAVTEATTTTYTSESPDGLKEKSGSQSKADNLDVTVKIEVDPLFGRFFKSSVVDVASKTLNFNQGGK